MVFSQEFRVQLQESLAQTIDRVESQFDDGTHRCDEVEGELRKHLFELGRQIMQGAVDVIVAEEQQNAPEVIERMGRPALQQVARKPRRFVTIFGELRVGGPAYAIREKQRVEYAPVDRRLSLPEGEFSYLFESWAQRMAVKDAFQETADSLIEMLDISVSIRSLERMNQRLAEEVETFRLQQPAPPMDEEGELVVVLSDATGTPMRERQGEAQMAYLGASYTLDRFVRTVDDVLEETLRKQVAKGRPRPLHKRLYGDLSRVLPEAPDLRTDGRVGVFTWLEHEISTRNPLGDKPVICLMDGETKLWSRKRELLPDTVIEILDLWHVMDRIREIAATTHGAHTPTANDFTEQRLRSLLEGRVGYVIGGLRQMLTKQQPRGTLRKQLTYPQHFAKNHFYYKAQFGDGHVDFSTYRTHLTLEGQRIDSTRQETDTISRLIYGFASAYLLTGDDRYLEVAEKGTEYLRQHMRAVDEDEKIAYWYHAIDVKGGKERKVLASEFGDDFEALAAYEQIYALAGPVQTFRITGDPRILQDAEWTINLFDKHFLDTEKGGYFSHIDPINLDPRDLSLTHNRARKNWNSVGDHAPAYLINLCLATGEQHFADFLASTADTIAEHFPDYDYSPFVNEKFNADWSHDLNTPLQKNRSIVGHNLKIAWNLMRVHHMRAKDSYVAMAKKIGDIMPKVGMDKQRGGWYDMVERVRGTGEQSHRLIWHDRKAWWQQEQAILAYLILAGSLKNQDYLRLARESAAFYNAWFPDHDSGGVYFNVLANGIPYLLGTERLKGSHSMSGYHSFELCYLAAVYTNLLLTKQPLDLYFKPQPDGFKDGILRVAPDYLPEGSIRIEAVWINDEPYANFDADALTVQLPVADQTVDAGHPLEQRPAWHGNPSLLPSTSKQELRVKVRIAPAGMQHDMELNLGDGTAELMLAGTFDDAAELALQRQLEQVIASKPARIVFLMTNLASLSKSCARALAFTRERIQFDTDLYLVAPTENVKSVLQGIGFLEEAEVVDDVAQIKAK